MSSSRAWTCTEVDHEWRVSACQAHSGTHVVHAALRQVLGPNALQSGSYNKPGYLRLDFAWSSALDQATRSEIEEVANLAVRQDLPVSAQYMTLPEARDWVRWHCSARRTTSRSGSWRSAAPGPAMSVART